jgi:predicted acylesterase/phospholipase RssA
MIEQPQAIHEETMLERKSLRIRLGLKKKHNKKNHSTTTTVNHVVEQTQSVTIPRSITPSTPQKTKFNVLCLDGGGMKGMAQIEFLRQLERATGKPIYELFDLFVGTSTGAILACLMSIHKTADQALDYYSTLGVDIFSKKQRYMLSVLNNEHKGMYSAKKLQQCMRMCFGDHVLYDPEFPCPRDKVLIVAAELNSLEKYQTVLFRNYEAPVPDRGSDFKNVKFVEAIRASTAAPFYFDSAYVNGHRFIDGGVLHNNPTLQGIMEARALFGKDKKLTVVNFGNGERKRPLVQDFVRDEGVAPTVTPFIPGGKKKQSRRGGYFSKNIVRLLNVCADNDRIIQDVQKYIASSCDKDQIDYYRFSPPDLGDLNLATSDRIILNKMVQDTEQYVQENKELFQSMANSLLSNE